MGRDAVKALARSVNIWSEPDRWVARVLPVLRAADAERRGDSMSKAANIAPLTAAIEKVEGARTAVATLPHLVGASADQQADLDVADVSFGAAISALDRANEQLRIARALLAYADASTPPQRVLAG